MSGMKPLLWSTVGGHLLLLIAAAASAGTVREGLRRQVLKNPESYSPSRVLEAVRAAYPRPLPEADRRAMLLGLRDLTRRPALFRGTPPDDPLKDQVVGLLGEAADATLPAAEEELLFDLLCQTGEEERALLKLLPESARKALRLRLLDAFEGLLRAGEPAVGLPIRPGSATAPYRTPLTAAELLQRIDPSAALPVEACRELVRRRALKLASSPAWEPWIARQVANADPAALQAAARGVLSAGKGDAEIRESVLRLLPSGEDQIDSAAPLLFGGRARLPEEALILDALGELRGEPRLRFFRAVLADALAGGLRMQGPAGVVRKILEAGGELPPGLFPGMLDHALRSGGEEPLFSLFARGVAQASLHDAFLRRFDAADAPERRRLQLLAGKIDASRADAAGRALLQRMAVQALADPASAAQPQDLLKHLDLSDPAARAKVIELVLAGRVRLPRTGPYGVFRSAQPKDGSALYAQLIVRRLERPEFPPASYLGPGGELVFVTEPTDIAFVRERVGKLRPELLRRYFPR